MTANRPIEVWEAALGRHVVLIEARTWFEARDVARTMLGGEPWYLSPPTGRGRDRFAWDWPEVG